MTRRVFLLIITSLSIYSNNNVILNTDPQLLVFGGLGSFLGQFTSYFVQYLYPKYYFLESSSTTVYNSIILNGTIPPFASLAQERCLKRMENFIRQQDINKPVISLASSQGGGTLIQYLATHPYEASKFSMVILDAPLMSANHSGIHIHKHILKNIPLPTLPAQQHDAFSYYCAVARTLKKIFPYYREDGTQPHNALEKFSSIDTSLKIVFIHSKHDPIVDYWGSVYAYLRLRELGFKNVFLVDDTLNTKKHVNRFNLSKKSIAFINALYEDNEEKIESFRYDYQPNINVLSTRLNHPKLCVEYINRSGVFSFISYDLQLQENHHQTIA